MSSYESLVSTVDYLQEFMSRLRTYVANMNGRDDDAKVSRWVAQLGEAHDGLIRVALPIKLTYSSERDLSFEEWQELRRLREIDPSAAP
jgi:hypothetical protein